MTALTLWRMSMGFHRRGLRWPSRFCKALLFLFFDALLDPEVVLEGHVNLAHGGLGVGIHGSTVLGDWVQIHQYAMISSNNDKRDAATTGVRVGRGVMIGAHAIILCPRGRTLTIGEGARIGAGAIVVDDVPAGAVVIPQPSRIVETAR